MRVLVVDDSPDVRFMLRILLEDAGMEIDEVTSERAAELLQERREKEAAGLVGKRRTATRGRAPGAKSPTAKASTTNASTTKRASTKAKAATKKTAGTKAVATKAASAKAGTARKS